VTLFIFVAIVMVAIALAWVLWPLLLQSRNAGIGARAANLSVFKDQFADLERDLERGTLSTDAYAEARAELERRLLDDTQADVPLAGRHPGSARTAAMVLAVSVPLVAGLMYWRLGAHDAFTLLATTPEATHQMSDEQMAAIAEQLRARLEKEPGNAEGWIILARTYYTMRKFPEAAAAYEKLTQIIPNDADLLADYADALAMSQDRTIAGPPLELVKQALAIDPRQWKALAMAGTEAFDRKDYAAAIDYWERLKLAVPPDSQIAKQIQGSVDEARQLAGMPAATPSPALAAVPPAATPKAGSGAAAGGRYVSGTVTLSPELAAKANPADAVFVFARPGDGSRMPIAIVRAQVKDLPLSFTLDDARSMSPEARISTFDEVIIAARISRSGNASATSGDLEGLTTPVKVGASGLAVTIDRVVP
jgi:cytochrome c-type biogenesis protein CcmH